MLKHVDGKPLGYILTCAILEVFPLWLHPSGMIVKDKCDLLGAHDSKQPMIASPEGAPLRVIDRGQGPWGVFALLWYVCFSQKG